MEIKYHFLILFFSILLIPALQFAQENEAPKVQIISPLEHVALKNGSIIPYSITVSDKEDGHSAYDEININEVFLTVMYFSDTSIIKAYVEEKVALKSELLSLIGSSNCFTCHKAKDKWIGPSFEEIANQYSPTLENKTYLTQKINQGSQGVWGEVIMPGQPELDEEEISQILDWVFKNANDPNFTFYTGTENAFKIKKLEAKRQNKGAYVLHAQYTDHGLKGYPENSKKGEHTIVVNVE